MFFLNSYWINRIIKKTKSKGIIGLLKSIFNFLNKIFNPKHTGEFPLKHFFLKKRRLIKKFTKKNLNQLDDSNIVTVGNYLIKENIINSNSVIYSFGIGENLGFEKKMSEIYNCKVYCFDPTSLAINFMKNEKYDDNKIIYQPYGIWKDDGKIKFFYQDEKNLNKSGGSITNLFETSSYNLLDCFKLATLMKRNEHSYIDIIKLDIEGAGIDVIEDFINDEIFPGQIVVEFEYSENDHVKENDFASWSNRLKKIINVLKTKNYKCYNLPRYSHLPYSTIEVLFIRN